jgi:hypothetical protein
VLWGKHKESQDKEEAMDLPVASKTNGVYDDAIIKEIAAAAVGDDSNCKKANGGVKSSSKVHGASAV